MDEDKITKFIKQLSKDTLAKKISWRRLTNYENIRPDSNELISSMLFQNEYHHINFFSSYYSIVSNGTIYIVYEVNESGRDGTITNGYNIYLHDEDKNKLISLPCPMSTIYQLTNSIQLFLENEESDAASFIDDYFSQN